MLVYLFSAITVCLFSKAYTGGHWSYSGISGPSNWSLHYPDCGKVRQSPVDIVTSNTIFDNELDTIQLTVERTADAVQNLVVVNNGHTVNLEHIMPVIRLTGGNLRNTFRVAGIHFHWGKSNIHGSEHTINGHHYPLEMHMVSYNEDRYDKLGAAINSSDGLAVIGLLFQESSEDNQQLEPLIGTMKEVKLAGGRVNLSDFDVTKFLPSSVNDYYRYLGSLTTPPCYESVTWTVLRQISNVSRSQLESFGTLQSHGQHDGSSHTSNMFIDQNWRPIQPINNRKISRSFGDHQRITILSKSEPANQQSVNNHAHKTALYPWEFILITYIYVAIRS